MMTFQRIEIRIDMAIAELHEAREFSQTAKERLARIDEAIHLLTRVREPLADLAEAEREKDDAGKN